MAKQLSKSGIATGDVIEPGQITQSIDALTGTDAYDLTVSGSLTVTGSLNMSGSIVLPTGSILEGTASIALFALNGGGGGGGTPGGGTNSVQFRNASIQFDGTNDFLFNNATKTLSVPTASLGYLASTEISSSVSTVTSSSLGFISSSYILATSISASTIQAGTFVGNISADEIRTPALIDGVASTLQNASASITPLGFARFVSASIGGWDISTDAIESDSMIMRPVGILQTKNFASGVSGWKISAEGNGTAEFENAVIRGTLRTTTFEKESVNAVGGQLWIANSTTISASFVSASATTMSVANASGYVAGEILMSKKIDNTGFTTEYILVNSSSVDGDGSGTDSTFGRLMVTRGYDSGSTGDFVGGVSGISQSYTDGQVLVSTGKSGSGYIKMNASPNDTATPFIDITERTGSGVYDVLLKARLGDLSGLANSDYVFNRPNPGFGLATDNVFLQGGIKATFGEIGGFNITNSLISSSNQNLILKADGTMTASGGFLFGNKAASQYVQYDGSSLVVRGDLSVDNIKTPAVIAGAPATETNASASINALGFARFVSASIGGFVVNEDEIKSSNNRLRLQDNGHITASGGVLLGSKSSNQYLEYNASNGLVVRGDLSVDSIQTPALIAGAPSTETNASASINALGFARFTSASIAGFEVNTEQIKASNNQLVLSSSGEFLAGNKSSNQYVEYDGTNLVVRGDLSVDSIQTPALIAGAPSTETNASASINALGFARFTSASIAGFTVNTEEIKSSDQSLRLKADGNITASKVLLGDKTSANYVQYDGSTLTVRGDISVDAIRTPATIAGAPSTTSNASASIDANGFAKFVSASIGGFDITDNTIGFEIPASSSTSTTNTNVTLSTNVPNTTVGGSNTATVTSTTTGATSGQVFSNAYIKAQSPSADHFSQGGTGTDTGRISSINISTGALTLASGYTWGTYYDETPSTLLYRLYTDSGATNQTFVSSSTQTNNFPATQSLLLDATNQRIIVGEGGGSITASAGLIGGTEISGDSLQSTNDISPTPTAGSNGKAFQLKSDGTISGSALYIREVISTDGTNNIVYPLFDSEQGLVDGKNVGRVIATNNTLYERSGQDDGTQQPYTASEHFVQLMPYETSLLFNFQHKAILGSGGGGVVSRVIFKVEKLSASGSVSGTEFNNWTAVDNTPVSSTIGATNSTGTAMLRVYDEGLSIDLPEADQAAPLKIMVCMGTDLFSGATTSSSNKSQLQGYTITATRALSISSAGNPGTALPSKF